MAMVYFVFANLLLGIIRESTGRCLYGDNEECAFHCHCRLRAECERSCPSGCESAALGYDWMGPGCQIAGNVALKKTAHQTKTFRMSTADLGVDGILPRTLSRDFANCAVPNGDYGRWWVDLGEPHKIYNVTIYFRLDRSIKYAKRDSDFTITVKNKTGGSSECAVRTGRVFGTNITLPCQTPLIGNVVEFTRIGGYDQQISTLCEVVIIGHKYIDCSLCPDGEECSDVIGCTKCRGSYQPECKEECDRGYYGINCKYRCGNCFKESVCGKVSGACPEGCQTWWVNEKCDLYIDKPTSDNDTIIITRTTSSSLTVSWIALNVSLAASVYYGYDVRYKEQNQTGFILAKRLKNSVIYEQVTINNLKPDHFYDIQVKPYRTWNNITEYGIPYVTFIQTDPIIPENGPPNTVIIIASTVTACILIILGLVLLIVFLLRKRRRKDTKTDNELSKMTRTTLSGDGEVKFGPDLGSGAVNNLEESEEEERNVPNTSSDAHCKKLDVIRNCSTENETPQTLNAECTTDAHDGPRRPDHVKPTSDDQLSLDEEPIYGNTLSDPDKPSPVRLEDFEAYAEKKKSDMNVFMAEYMSLPADNKSACLTGRKGHNKTKNRYRNIFPYEDTRVILNTTSDNKNCDYINASYIKGANRDKEYIATQGPIQTTIKDFWEMIWQEETNLIVMLANLTENGKARCHQYWPESFGETLKEGIFSVTSDDFAVTADYTTRNFTLKKGNKKRRIRQFHFTTWEDKNKPLYGGNTLLAFYKIVHSFDKDRRGPMVVHCSAGVGRTGTFIALDILQQEVTRSNVVDVYQCVTRLRTERMNMVQTVEQYILVHDVLSEYIKCGQTSYVCNEFKDKFAMMCGEEANKARPSESDKQIKLLEEMKKSIVDNNNKAELLLSKHRKKTHQDVKKENEQPNVAASTDEEDPNVIFVDSFRSHDFYVVTKMPLSLAVKDFWELIFQTKSQAIVMLNQIDKSMQPYWPNEEGVSQHYGPFEIILLNSKISSTSDSVIIRDICVKHEKQHKDNVVRVRQFQLLSWPNEQDVPSKMEDILRLLEMLQDWQEKNMSSTSKNIIVHCLTGLHHSGLFCAASFILDKMKTEQMVDAFLAVRCVTRRQPNFLQLKTQYKFLYELCLYYMEHFNTYENFQYNPI